MSHYYQPEISAEVQEAGLDDWAEALLPLSRQAIEHATRTYIRDQPRRRPTPGDIRARAVSYRTGSGEPQNQGGDRAKLSPDELQLLDGVLKTARRWVQEIPGLAHHGAKTLDYWGEAIPEPNVLPKTREERMAAEEVCAAAGFTPRRMTAPTEGD